MSKKLVVTKDEQPNRLTPDQMLSALDSIAALAWQLAASFAKTYRDLDLHELHAVASWAFKVAAMKYDPRRGAKFITVAYQYARFELIHYCRCEVARGLHVPENHPVWFAPRLATVGVNAKEHEHNPHDHRANPNSLLARLADLGEDFWTSATRTLDRREREVIIGTFRDDQRQIDIAARLGISKQRVGQLLDRAMLKIGKRDDLKRLAVEVAA